MIEIGFGIAAFTLIVTVLTVTILMVRAWLAPSGEVLITVNGIREVHAGIGSKLLDALADAGLRLPSACGGVGTCGQCRLRVVTGGGEALPTEAARLNRRELAAGGRLACQVSVREPLEVEVPDAAFGSAEWRCRIRSCKYVAPLIKEIILEMPEGERLDFRAGAYVQVDCPPYRAPFSDFDVADAYRPEWDRLSLWRLEGSTASEATRAYSLANGPDETDQVRLVVRLAIPPPTAIGAPPGVVSSYLFSLKPGDEVAIFGPFGTFFATDSDREMIFIGGGAGMAPMRAHILYQLERVRSGRKISFWYGARNLRELFYREDFDGLETAHDNFCWRAALSEPRPEDAWDGPTGFIHQVLLDEYLKDHPAPEDCEYYLCGPPMMVKAVRAMLDNLGVDPEAIFFDDFGG